MLFSFHLLETRPRTGVRLLARRRAATTPRGLHHAETLALMELGAPILSPRRLQLGHPAMFAAWASSDDLDAYLTDDTDGRLWAGGWHVRLEFVRRWGHVAAFDHLPAPGPALAPGEPAVAVTLARLELPQVPRFIRWGRPVERQVRDHPGQALAVAAAAPPRTVSTFTVWRTARAMTDMVRGRSDAADGRRHAAAMAERDRKDFHREFTTLRFRCLGEHGSWRGRTHVVPRPFVPAAFSPPTGLDDPAFRLRPLGPEHNDRDHAAWMGSIDHIRATPGYPDGRWPSPMSLEENLADLRRHRGHFRDRVGFTYSVLDPVGPEDEAEVIGCVYLYPDDHPGFDVHVQSWVRADRADLDAPLAAAVRAWLEEAWPWRPERVRDHRRHATN